MELKWTESLVRASPSVQMRYVVGIRAAFHLADLIDLMYSCIDFYTLPMGH